MLLCLIFFTPKLYVKLLRLWAYFVCILCHKTSVLLSKCFLHYVRAWLMKPPVEDNMSYPV